MGTSKTLAGAWEIAACVTELAASTSIIGACTDAGGFLDSPIVSETTVEFFWSTDLAFFLPFPLHDLRSVVLARLFFNLGAATFGSLFESTEI